MILPRPVYQTDGAAFLITPLSRILIDKYTNAEDAGMVEGGGGALEWLLPQE